MAGGGRSRRRWLRRDVGDGRCPPAVLADALAEAADVDHVERIVTAELRRWIDPPPTWVAVASTVPGAEGRTPRAGGDELVRVLAALPAGLHHPVVCRQGRGHAVAAPCGAGSDRVLVVASPRALTAPVVDAIGEVAAMVGLAARTHAAEAALARRRRTSRFEEVVRFASDAIFIVDAGGTIRYSAPSVTTVLGHRSGALVGAPLESLVVDHHRADLRTFLRRVAFEPPRRPISVEMLAHRADDSRVPVELTGANLLGNADVRGIVVTARDVSARRQLEEQLRHQAFHDPLTGLANRALFADRLGRAMSVRRDPGDLAPAVAFIDLDDFKDVNDTLGHAVGDTVLVAVADRIAGCVRGADTAARLGGDEFALLVEDVPDERSLHDLVARVVDSVRRPISVEGGRQVRVRASVGIAASGAGVTTADDLLRHADLAMYRDKSAAKAEAEIVVDLLA